MLISLSIAVSATTHLGVRTSINIINYVNVSGEVQLPDLHCYTGTQPDGGDIRCQLLSTPRLFLDIQILQLPDKVPISQ